MTSTLQVRSINLVGERNLDATCYGRIRILLSISNDSYEDAKAGEWVFS